MIFSDNIFNNSTLNIFTDASITKKNGETIGCAGYIATTGHNPTLGVISSETNIIRESTNNHSEITAISMGIDYAIKMKNTFPVINLFSDSKLCIYGLKEWIFQWVNRSGTSDTLIGTYNQEISNQHIILNIIYKILDNNLSITLYHQNGHVSTESPKAIAEARENFVQINRLIDDVHVDLIRNISTMNNQIDSLTRFILKNSCGKYPRQTNDLVRYIYQPFDVQKYARLIHVV